MAITRGGIMWALVLVLLFLSGIVIVSLPYEQLASPGPVGSWEAYLALLYGTGVLAIGLMSFAMLLALRPPWLDKLLGGLDRSYRVHKWLGILGVLSGLLHYLIKLGSKQLRASELLIKPEHYPSRSTELFGSLHDLGKLAGEWGLYALLALVVVALWQRIAYRRFVGLHRLMAALFLVVAFHALVFIPTDYWASVAGPVSALLILLGSVAAVMSLSGRIGSSRRAAGVITEVNRIGADVLEIQAKMDTKWHGHRSGQFALVSFDSREGHHPFTIASAWKGDGKVRFAIKSLGDYTAGLTDRLAVGDRLVIEGPYGGFDYEDDSRQQVWIAGGVGLTPFVARLEELAARGGADYPVDLFYSTRQADPGVVARLKATASKAGVSLHVLESPVDGPLTVDRLAETVGNWKDTSVWFCGPPGFGQAMREGLEKKGLTSRNFHQELFQFR